MRILVTNDDGIDSEGLIVLARTLRLCGHEVVIAAPREDYSGYGSAIGPLHVKGHVDYEARDIEALTGLEAYAIDGPLASARSQERTAALASNPTSSCPASMRA